jgi:hypothetical protein
MTWFAFKGYPDVSVAGEQEKTLAGIGFHGYSTQAQADAHPNSVNAVQAPVLNVIEYDYTQAQKEGATPGGPNNLETPGGIAGAITSAAGSDLGISGLIKGIESKGLWIRVGEVFTGIILLYAGLKAMTGLNPVSAVAKRVKR